MMFNPFKSKPKITTLPFQVDIHSHLLPGLDDGVKSENEALYVLKVLINLGYKKIVTTPHVMSEYYPNNASNIHEKLVEIKDLIKRNDLNVILEAAAEYYLDETFMEKLSNQEKLLTIGENYVLFETPFLNKPAYLEEAIFSMNTQGYKPVLAHPERYGYLHSNMPLLEKLKSMNVLFQLNLLSLAGYYSSEVKKMAEFLLKEDVIDLVGTDCHNAHQANEIVKNLNSKSMKLLYSRNFLNTSLL